MPTCLIGLGSNLGDRRQHLERALDQLGHSEEVRVERVSEIRETRPIGGPANQPPFLNACARLQTTLSPHAILLRLHGIEQMGGRERRQRWGARTIDLDLLLYDDRVIGDERLQVPHPRLAFRRFVLEPAAEIAGDLVHPQYQRTISQLAARLNETPRFVSLAGGTANERADTARKLAVRLSGTLLTFEDAASRASDSEAPPSVAARGTASTVIESVDARDVEYRQGHGPKGDLGPAVTSRPVARELEFLRHSSQSIAASARTESTGPRWLVSDFWWEQVLLTARHRLESAEWAALEELAAGIRPNHPQPRLLAVLPDPPRHRFSLGTDRAEVADKSELASQAERVGQAPLLWVAGLTQDDAILEIAAAMEAMQ